MKRKLLLIGLVLLLASLIIGCPAPVVEEPAAPVVEEPAIPAHFTTYTDESGLFSISYPEDWELVQWGVDIAWTIEDIEQRTKEVIESIELDRPLERGGLIFRAGAPLGFIGLFPMVEIRVEPLPGVGWTLDEVVEASYQEAKDLMGEDYHEFSPVKTTIGGREAVIVESELTMPPLGKFRYLTMTTLVGKTVWTVICTSEPGKFDQSEDDFYAIVRSLLILK